MWVRASYKIHWWNQPYNYKVEGITDTDSENGSEVRPILSSLSLLLSDECKSVLASHLPLNSLTENYGVEHYLKSVEIIKNHTVAVPGSPLKQQ